MVRDAEMKQAAAKGSAQRIRRRAVTRLAELYPEDYAELLADETKRDAIMYGYDLPEK